MRSHKNGSASRLRLVLLTWIAALISPVVLAQISAPVSANGPRAAGREPARPRPSSSDVSTPDLITFDDIQAAVTGYVGYASFRGAVRFYDPQEREEVRLTLQKVLGDKLQSVGPTVYLASAQFASPEQKTYTIDFFIQAGEGLTRGVIRERTAIREVDGISRYRWAYDEKRDLYIKSPLTPAEPREPVTTDTSSVAEE